MLYSTLSLNAAASLVFSDIAGMQVVPLKQLSLSELSQHDGRNPDMPMYIAIRGTIFDVTAGRSQNRVNLVPPPQGLHV